MAMLLLPAGVRSIRAEDGAERLMSVDPALVSTAPSISEAPPGAPVIGAGDTDRVLRPGIAGSEVQPGAIGFGSKTR